MILSADVKTMTKANVFGWYNRQNVGDEAFKNAFTEGFRLLGENVEVFFGYYNPKDQRSIILGGGDVIKPYYIKRVGDTVVFPIGVGLGYESEGELLRTVNVPVAVVRNLRDVEVLRSMGINCEYCPDITFVLPQPAPKERDLGNKKSKRLGILLSDEVNPTFENQSPRIYTYYEYFKWELAEILDVLTEYYEIVFIPFSTLDSIDDRKIHGDIFRRMSKREDLYLESGVLDVMRAREIIASCDLIVSMKYHGILFSVQAGVPFINIGETRKTHLFCEENELSMLSMPRYSLERERFFSLVKFAETDEARRVVREVGEQLRYQAKKILPRALARMLAHGA